MTTLKIDVVRMDGGTQARAELDEATLERYTDLLREAREETGTWNVWPFKDPVEVYYDGSVYWLFDGFHRVTACLALQMEEIQANVSQGTQRDAILESFGANETHGLRPNSADKRRSVTRMLKDEEWGKWSDREIARRCKVSHPTVAAIRKELAEVTGKFTSERVYVDKNGNEAVMNTANIGSGQPAPPSPITYEDDDVYAWLRDYEGQHGRRWSDLDDSQVLHANSPCYQAYVQAFPGQTDPKLLLKRALYCLQREAKEANETAVPSKPVPRLFVNEAGEFEASQRGVNKDAVVAEELADLCRCNPIVDAFLDSAIANEAKEIAEMFSAEDELTTDSDEWYTPTWLIEKAKAVMGGIDIDPASSPAAQERVQATRWYGKDHMGLATGSLNINWVHHNGPHWQPTRVWLNPPYSFPLVGQFVEKLLEQIEKGYVGEAILLVNNNTETDWWHKAAAAAAVTFTFRSRVFFWRPGREDATSPRQGQNAFYFGDNALEFIETFNDKGMSFMRWDTSAFNEEEE